ncbi:MAG: hypothetical protein ACI8ZB_001877 [Desulforhopalus sp.]|jgi:hypothetical protein
MAMLTSRTSFRNHLLFGNLNFGVTPFLINFLLLAYQVLTGRAQANIIERSLGLPTVGVNVWAERG